MKQLILIISTVLFSICSIIAQDTRQEDSGQTLTVHVHNIKSDNGKISVGVYDSSGNWLSKTLVGKTSLIREGKATVVFENMKNGEYGISLYHDKNDNGRLDSGLFGIPKEPYACSNGAKGMFGPPKWKDAKFMIQNNHAEHIIRL